MGAFDMGADPLDKGIASVYIYTGIPIGIAAIFRGFHVYGQNDLNGTIMKIIYTSFQALRTALIIGFLVFSGSAFADDIFTVSGVKVDVTAENAVAAREMAFNEGQAAAFKVLAGRVLGEDEAKGFRPPEPTVISGLIQDFEVTDERLSAVEYIGTYTFRFDPVAVKRHFNVGGGEATANAEGSTGTDADPSAVVAEVETHPLLILPFYQWSSRIVLWQDTNPWLKAWARYNNKGGLVPVIVPMGDIRDIADIGDDQALTYRHDSLTQILSRYGAGEAVVLMAVPGPADAADIPVDLSIMIYRTDREAPEYVQTLKITPDQNSTADALYDKAVKQVRSLLQKGWKSDVASSTATATMLQARVQFRSMQQWVETRQALRRVSGIRAVNIRSVTPREARVELEYMGNESNLQMAMGQQEILLTPPSPDIDGPTSFYGILLKKYAVNQ